MLLMAWVTRINNIYKLISFWNINETKRRLAKSGYCLYFRIDRRQKPATKTKKRKTI